MIGQCVGSPAPGHRSTSDSSTLRRRSSSASFARTAASFPVPAAEVAHDARTLLSYLADALAMRSPQVLLEHLAWRRGFDERRGRPAGYGAALLRSLAAAVDPASPARALLTRAQESRP